MTDINNMTRDQLEELKRQIEEQENQPVDTGVDLSQLTYEQRKQLAKDAGRAAREYLKEQAKIKRAEYSSRFKKAARALRGQED